ncbi:hypothetical protein SPBR_00883 [Sporothrix brasiliensis 5110]|uniref:Iron-sulfur cluster assembly accessory protein n=1 Tax=Sporothrix brasiliensis 5110 TaxID=1398154 RepID=A0A0C2FHD6_9PEZI|nr:uncharacterized protein SPBR_00883 [Sporothrix brasiliensis 5110]KIH90493.1 hypothetical protein SPBR_00883 [Sporothrix brasiliensis 5110]
MASIPICSHALAAASSAPRSILHLWRALCLAPGSGPSSSPILDFLLPPSASSAYASSRRRGYATTPSSAESQARTRQHRLASSRRHYASRLSRPSVNVSSWTASRNPTNVPQPRSFATTAPRGTTQTLLNPQMDDEGNEMRLEITSRAAKRLAKVMEKDGNSRLALRIQVESGGCHGFQYLMSLVTLPEQLPTTSGPDTAVEPDVGADAGGSEPVIRDDDTIFTYAGEDSGASSADPLAAPKIILDTPSLQLLKGSKVDFTMELIGSQFKIVDNPLATSSCGCGTSFDIKA